MGASQVSGSLTTGKFHESSVGFAFAPRLIVSVQFVVGGQVVGGVEPQSSARIMLTVAQAGLAILDADVAYEVYTPRGQLIATGGAFVGPQGYRIEWLPTWTPDEGEYLVHLVVTHGANKRTVRLRVPIRYPDGNVQRLRNLELRVRVTGEVQAQATLT